MNCYVRNLFTKNGKRFLNVCYYDILGVKYGVLNLNREIDLCKPTRAFLFALFHSQIK